MLSKISPNNFLYPHPPVSIKMQQFLPIIVRANSQDGNQKPSSKLAAQQRKEIDEKDMSGYKRDRSGQTKRHDGQKQGGPAKPVVRNAYTPMFEHFRDELDEHHDRRERVVKASRDITALSKKM